MILFIPIIPMIMLITAAVVMSGTITIIVYRHLKGKSIAILGMKGAGKTQMLANMRNMPYSEYTATLNPEKYDSFTIHLGNRDVRIAPGKDIAGGEEWIKPYYKEMIEKNDIVFFLFSATKYLNESTYNYDVRARLDFINEHIKEKEPVIFATFADKLKDGEEAFHKIMASISGKGYEALFKDNFVLLDTRDKKELMKHLNKIFS